MATGHALIVGASSDIGAEIAADLAELGYDISAWGRNEARLQATVERCRGTGQRAVADVVDVTDHPLTLRAAARLGDREPLSAVVWAAGIFDWAAADSADPFTWARVLDVNLTAAAFLTPLVLPQLLSTAPSTLVYIGSGAARQTYAHNAAYVASKHGLAGLAGATFLDVRDRGVKVSLISPGLVAAGAGLLSGAGRHHPERLLTASDVAAAVRFVVTFPGTGCPTEIRLEPQRTPDDAP